MTTTRTFTFSMTPDMARAIVQHLIDARLIESATDPLQTFLKERGIYVISHKGLHVLERFTAKNGVEYPQLPILLETQPICVKLIQLQRRAEDDDIVITKPIIHALFRRFAGSRPNYVPKKNGDQDPFQKLHERSKGIILKDFTTSGRSKTKHRCCFTAVSAMEWMCDFTSVVGREEAAEIAAQFCRFRLISLVSEDDRDEDSIVFTVRGSGPDDEHYSRGEFVCSQAAIYKVTEEGRQLLHWDTALLTTAIDNAKSRSTSSLSTSESTKLDCDSTTERRSVKDSNFNRLRYVLEKPMLRSLFREFLRASYCEENLSFWLDVNDFKRKFSTTSSVKVADDTPPAGGKSHGQDAMERHHDYLVRLGFQVYNNYLAASCPAELSLDSRLRSECSKFLADVLVNARSTKPFKNYLEPEHKPAFDTSQLQRMIMQYDAINASVMKTMALDSIPKFVETATYIAAHNQLDLEDSGSDIKFLTPSDDVPDQEFSGIYISVSRLAGESRAGKFI
ncbi:hypothetical protein ONZ45_g11919 [Pleurotus djamor]|nr:hypothetical protein ONZ45_g11919 [Pleurotus djamor]